MVLAPDLVLQTHMHSFPSAHTGHKGVFLCSNWMWDRLKKLKVYKTSCFTPALHEIGSLLKTKGSFTLLF